MLDLPSSEGPYAGKNAWVRELYDLFAPVRESVRGYSEQEINDMIDEALAKCALTRREQPPIGFVL